MRFPKSLFTLCVLVGGCATTPETAPPSAASASVAPSKSRPDWNAIDFAPAALSERSPQYPFEDARAQKPGDVKIIFGIDEGGHVRNLSVVESSAPEFSSVVTQAISQWTFPPQAGGPFKREFRFVPTGGMSGEIDWK
jgi:TonB family protein